MLKNSGSPGSEQVLDSVEKKKKQQSKSSDFEKETRISLKPFTSGELHDGFRLVSWNS